MFDDARLLAAAWFCAGVVAQAVVLGGLTRKTAALLGVAAGAGAVIFAIGWTEFDDVLTMLFFAFGPCYAIVCIAFLWSPRAPGDEHVFVSLIVSLWGWALSPASPVRPDSALGSAGLWTLLGAPTAMAVYLSATHVPPSRTVRGVAHGLHAAAAGLAVAALFWTTGQGYFWDEAPRRLPHPALNLAAGAASLFLSMYIARAMWAVGEMNDSDGIHQKMEAVRELGDEFHTDRLPLGEAWIVTGLQAAAFAANAFLRAVPDSVLFVASVLVLPQWLAHRALRNAGTHWNPGTH